MTKTASATERTSVGEIVVDYAFDSWVLVETPTASEQRRVRSAGELASLLEELGLPEPEARPVAAELWRQRPFDARVRAARPWEAGWRTVGVSAKTYVLLAILAPFAAAGILILLYLLLWA